MARLSDIIMSDKFLDERICGCAFVKAGARTFSYRAASVMGMPACSLQLYVQCAADQNRKFEERSPGFADDFIIVAHLAQ